MRSVRARVSCAEKEVIAFFSNQQGATITNPLYHLSSAHHVFYHMFVYCLEHGYLQPRRSAHLGGPIAQEYPFRLIKEKVKATKDLTGPMPQDELILRLVGNSRATAVEDKRGWLPGWVDNFKMTAVVSRAEYAELSAMPAPAGAAVEDNASGGLFGRGGVASAGYLGLLVPEMGPEVNVAEAIELIQSAHEFYKKQLHGGSGKANMHFMLCEILTDIFAQHLHMNGAPVTAQLSKVVRARLLKDLMAGDYWFGMEKPYTRTPHQWSVEDTTNVRKAVCYWTLQMLEIKTSPTLSKCVLDKSTGLLKRRDGAGSTALVGAGTASSSHAVASAHPSPQGESDGEEPSSKRQASGPGPSPERQTGATAPGTAGGALPPAPGPASAADPQSVPAQVAPHRPVFQRPAPSPSVPLPSGPPALGDGAVQSLALPLSTPAITEQLAEGDAHNGDDTVMQQP